MAIMRVYSRGGYGFEFCYFEGLDFFMGGRGQLSKTVGLSTKIFNFFEERVFLLYFKNKRRQTIQLKPGIKTLSIT